VPLTLTDLFTLTLEGNRDLRNQALERIVQRQQLAAAEQGFNPRLTPTLRVAAGRSTDGGDPIAIGPGEVLLGNPDTDLEQRVQLDATLTTRLGTRFDLGLTPLDGGQALRLRVSQPLLRGFGPAINEAPLNRARLEDSRGQLGLRQALIDTLTETITGYNTLINAQAQVEIQAQALERRQRQLDILRVLVEAGRQPAIDLFDLERSVAEAQGSLVNAQNQLSQANSALLNLIGTDRNLRFMVADDAIDQLFAAAVAQLATYQPQTLVDSALAQRPDYRQAQLLRQQQSLDLRVAEDNLRWQLNAVADGTLGDSDRSVVGLEANRTFGDPQPETDRLASAIALQQQDNTLAQLQDQIRNDVVAGLAEVRSTLQQVAAAEQATLNARRQLEAARRRGVPLFQLLIQEDALVNAETNELATRIDVLNRMAELERTAGITLERWAATIDLGEPWE
jgi:outer membrane protein TolC